MEVILKQDVKDLGKKDSKVKVSDGYAKNYLIPRGYAVEASAGNINELKNKQEAAASKAQRELEKANALAAAVKGKKVTLSVKAGENGKLFGSVSAKEVAEALAAQYGIDIDKKKLVFEDQMKTAGVHTVTAKLQSGVSAKFEVDIKGV